MGRPRVVVLITLAEVGGAQAYVAALLPTLSEHFEVTVAARGAGPVREAAERLELRYVGLRHLRRAIRPWRDLLALAELVRLFRRVRPDVLHASSSKAGVLGRLAAQLSGVPVRIFTVHGWAFAAASGGSSTFYRWADRLMRPLTTVTVCVSDNERAAGIAARTCDPARTVVIRNAVDVTGAPQARHDGAPPTLITVGRLKAPKDPVTLLRALAALPTEEFAALIVGDGPDRPAVEELSARLGLGGRVRLEGERRDVADLLAASDVFVLSSRSEGLPVSVLEAMAAGLPVVASDVGGVSELVIDGETGILVRPGDPDRLAEALEGLLSDPDRRRRLGEAGRARAERLFDLEQFRQAHLELYRRELARSMPSRPAP
jgi:glycosyltransferase involved in cell wall biosynthesis